jgi:hypothetical protein
MKKTILCCVLCFCLPASIGFAQQRVHALSGTVKSINPKTAIIEIDTDDGSSSHFEVMKKSGVAFDFDKAVSADAIPADKFSANRSHVIVYYFGDGIVRTAVALHDLGDGEIAGSTGTVVRLSKHDRTLTIKNASGAEEYFRIDPKTVADTISGVAQNYKFDFSKGDSVRVTAAKADGVETALLIAPAM